MKEDKKLILFFLVIILGFVSFYFDSEIVNGISSIRNSVLNEFFLGLTFVSSKIIIFFFLTSLFLWQANKRKWIFPLWVTLGLSVVVSFLIKLSVQRQRPFQLGIVSVLPILEKASHSVWNFSFPSFQTMLVFCAIPILSKQFPKLKYTWIIFAVLVAFSRVYFGLHFMSDIIAGGLIGYLIGMFVVQYEEDKKFGERIYKKFFGSWLNAWVNRFWRLELFNPFFYFAYQSTN